MLLVGMLEFGFVFEHDIALSYSTREGARVGAALASGGTSVPCAIVDESPPTSAGVDPLDHRRSPAGHDLARVARGALHVEELTIFKADSQGSPAQRVVNRWVYRPGAGPVVDGRHLDFVNTSTNWSACVRDNGSITRLARRRDPLPLRAQDGARRPHPHIRRPVRRDPADRTIERSWPSTRPTDERPAHADPTKLDRAPRAGPPTDRLGSVARAGPGHLRGDDRRVHRHDGRGRRRSPGTGPAA